MNQRYSISVQLVTYNGVPWLPYCLEALAAQTRRDFFLLIVDNGSIDKTSELVEGWLAEHPDLAARARMVKNKQNLGFARGHNQAISWTDSDYVLVLNQDVLLAETYLEAAAGYLEHDTRAAAVTGKLLTWKFDPATFYLGALPELQAASTIDSLGLKIYRSRRVTNLAQGEVDHGQYQTMRQVFGVAGTAPLYRREALMAVSPTGEVFDEDFVSYKEDVDLAWRLQLAGCDAWYVPEAVGYHDRSLAGAVKEGPLALARHRRHWPKELKAYSWVNHLGVMVKNEGALNFFLDLPWILAHELAKAGFVLLTEPTTLLRGMYRFIRLLPRFIKKRGQLKSTHRRKAAELRQWWAKG